MPRSEVDGRARTRRRQVVPAEKLPTRLPAAAQRFLPGIEPARDVDDWGRSQRLEQVFDNTLGDLLYDLWFRVEASNVDLLPSGGALLLSHRAGSLAPHAAMLSRIVRERFGPSRRLYVLHEPDLRAVPALGAMLSRFGCVPAQRANVERLLVDEGAFVLAFPEPVAAALKPLARRYRLARFTELDALATARAAGVPVLGAAVLGVEEANPTILARPRLPAPLRSVRRRVGRLSRRFPAAVRALARLPLVQMAFLPAKMRIDFVAVPDPGAALATRDYAELVRAAIEQRLADMLARRHSVWTG
ncbi:MAG: hypothetical protein K6T27_02055 [Thermoleophilum sp.]|nr:hypothetical protein [Thermoleophilum sp.]